MLSGGYMERLEAEGFGRLGEFLKRRYGELHGAAAAVESFVASKGAGEADTGKKGAADAARPKSGKKGPAPPADGGEAAEGE